MSMRKIREVLRLTHELGLSVRQRRRGSRLQDLLCQVDLKTANRRHRRRD